MRLHEAMRMVIRECGAAILEEKRLLSVLADYRAFEEFPAVRQILQSVVSDGYGKELCGKSLDGDSSEYLPCADKVKKALAADHHFKKELADYAVDCISYALRMIPSVTEPLDKGFEPHESGRSTKDVGPGAGKVKAGEPEGTGSSKGTASAERKGGAPAGTPADGTAPSEVKGTGERASGPVRADGGKVRAGEPAGKGSPESFAKGAGKTAAASGTSDKAPAPAGTDSHADHGNPAGGSAPLVKKGSGVRWAAAFIGVAAVIALAVGLSGGSKAPAGNGAAAPSEAASQTEPAAPLHEASSDVKAGKSEVVPSGDDAVAYAVGQSLGEYIGKTNRQQEEAGMRLDSSIIIEGFSDGITGSRDRLAGTDKQKLLMDFDARLKAKAEEADKKKSAVEIARGEKFLEENAKKDGVRTTESGLQYQVIEPAKDADAPRPDKNSVVTVFYKGTLLDGKVFDQNIGKDPIEFPLNAVIPGWSEGVSLMQKGAKYRFWIPPKLGYGDRAVGQIPANSVLVFEVELVDVKSGEEVKAEAEKAAAEKAKADEAEAAAPGGSR